MDTLTIYAISPQQSKTVVSEVKAVGPVRTHTNQLLVEFRSDCDTSLGGFRGVLTTVKSEENSINQSGVNQFNVNNKSLRNNSRFY